MHPYAIHQSRVVDCVFSLSRPRPGSDPGRYHWALWEVHRALFCDAFDMDVWTSCLLLCPSSDLRVIRVAVDDIVEGIDPSPLIQEQARQAFLRLSSAIVRKEIDEYSTC